jgi:hypothetical protein
MTAVLVGCALWLSELYVEPTWAKIRSFLLGYFLGTFVMEWVWQRSSRGLFDKSSEEAPPAAAVSAAAAAPPGE